jgi:glycine/D-amino acid oxidase-like deaminating enzyme
MPTRREVLAAGLAVPMTATLSGVAKNARGTRVAVVGAGAFGGWTALTLARQGAQVTLVEAWGPGNARASSGGETRVIRATYGTRRIYTQLAARARALWRAHDRAAGRAFFKRTGAIWLFGTDNAFGRASADALAAQGLPFEWLTPAESAARYPQFAYDGIASVLFEPEAGYLLARRACEHVAERFVAEGGTLRTAAAVSPVAVTGPSLKQLPLSDGSRLEADVFLFACGPWLGALFPDVIGSRVTPTRQEVFYFGTPPGDTRHSDDRLPVWVDFGERLIYGIPGNVHRGFKLADDTPGPRFDPTSGSRDLTREGVEAMRAFLKRRFPALAAAPFLGGEVCQYEASPDSHFIVDRHPAASNVWIAGGGSGHGYKMGPAMGEVLAAALLGAPLPTREWSLARLEDPARAEVEKWV